MRWAWKRSEGKRNGKVGEVWKEEKEGIKMKNGDEEGKKGKRRKAW